MCDYRIVFRGFVRNIFEIISINQLARVGFRPIMRALVKICTRVREVESELLR